MKKNTSTSRILLDKTLLTHVCQKAINKLTQKGAIIGKRQNKNDGDDILTFVTLKSRCDKFVEACTQLRNVRFTKSNRSLRRKNIPLYFEKGRGRPFRGRGCLFQDKIWTSICSGTAYWRPKKSNALQCYCIPCVYEMDVRVQFRKHWLTFRGLRTISVLYTIIVHNWIEMQCCANNDNISRTKQNIRDR